MVDSENTVFTHAVPSRVVLYSREGCHLCVDALEIVQRVCEATGQSFEVVDVDTAPELVAKYSDYVPVVEVDGVQQGFWRIDEVRLQSALV